MFGRAKRTFFSLSPEPRRGPSPLNFPLTFPVVTRSLARSPDEGEKNPFFIPSLLRTQLYVPSPGSYENERVARKEGEGGLYRR